jgi:multiple sugar transport system ATP-binding protein
MASVTLKNIKKRYDSIEVLHGIDLEIQDREFIMFVGPSGCGKSTLLRMIAGLEPITEGDMLIGGERVNDLSPAQRDIAMVFQDYALYPHMTVRQNMAFSLELRKTPQAEINARVERAAQMLRIEPYLDRKPKALSGGQRQRVAMGRAMVRDPKVFLFDEPLSNLDAKLRIDVRAEIKDLARRLQTTMIFVTHDQVEAMTMADRIVVLNAGKLQQVGAPEELYERPANIFVATFIGAPTMNLFTVTLQQQAEQWFACTPEGIRFAVAPAHVAHLVASGSTQFTMGLRPEHIGETPSAHSVQLSAPLTMVEPLGSDTYVYFEVGAKRCVGRISPERKPKLGDTLPMAFDMSRAHWFNAEGNAVGMA